MSVGFIITVGSERENEPGEQMRRRSERAPAERASQDAAAATSCASRRRREASSSAHSRRRSSASAGAAARSPGEAKCASRKPRRLVDDMGAWVVREEESGVGSFFFWLSVARPRVPLVGSTSRAGPAQEYACIHGPWSSSRRCLLAQAFSLCSAPTKPNQISNSHHQTFRSRLHSQHSSVYRCSDSTRSSNKMLM